jgi:hypothetical protein
MANLLALDVSAWLPGSLWVLAIGIVTAVISLWAARWYVLRLPREYFTPRYHPRESFRDAHPALRVGLKVLKNLLGATLLIVGLIMLVTPGQGILAILIGLSLLDLPGKRQLERWLVARPKVIRFLNMVRRQAGRPQFDPA